MRRAERAIAGADDVFETLLRCDALSLALCGEDAPYVVPVNFGAERKDGKIVLYLHCAGGGKKLELLKKDPRASICAFRHFGVYGADSPCSYTADYESVCGSGRAEIVTDEPSRLHALRVLLSHYTDRVFENESFEPRALAHTVVRPEVVFALEYLHHPARIALAGAYGDKPDAFRIERESRHGMPRLMESDLFLCRRRHFVDGFVCLKDIPQHCADNMFTADFRLVLIRLSFNSPDFCIFEFLSNNFPSTLFRYNNENFIINKIITYRFHKGVYEVQFRRDGIKLYIAAKDLDTLKARFRYEME